ncbi:MAG TPA: flagellar basal body rod protein FlgB [Acidobacteriota bacterium]|nr:flagellar basal body rod protein FlgB [Acidobacteriota bacterium]
MDIFKDSGIDRMAEYLDFASKRQQVINSNIANIETPGYRAKTLDFEHLFRAELEPGLHLRSTRAGHLSGPPELIREAARVRTLPTGALGNDLNNVDLDHETTQLAQNVLKFSAVAQMIQGRLSAIRQVIEGAR